MLIVPALGAAFALVRMARAGISVSEPALFAVMYTLTALGTTVGYHRMLAHRAFSVRPALRAVFAALGCTAGQGPPLYWVANHRRHHRYSDRDGDPHSPVRDGTRVLTRWAGLWHAHVGWTLDHDLTNTAAYCRDLLRDPSLRAVNRQYLFWFTIGLVVPAILGFGWEHSWNGALDGFLWGGLLRLFVSYHMSLSINSIVHVFGHQAFHTKDQSRNNAWLALPTFGEAWHNNHHAAPASAHFGLHWWQLDLGGAAITLLGWLGLAHDVRRQRQPTSRPRDKRRAS